MPITSISSGDVLSVRIIKTLTANPTIRWANTYEIQALGSLSTQGVRDAIDVLIIFERELHFNSVNFLYATASTYVEDSVPYNGDEFIRVNYSVLGNRAPGVDIEPLNICLRVGFVPETGRTGFRLYRGCLDEAQVNAPSGTPSLTSPTAMATLVSDAASASNLVNHFAGTSVGDWVLVMASNTSVRQVFDLTLQGVTDKKLNNKYFDRS